MWGVIVVYVGADWCGITFSVYCSKSLDIVWTRQDERSVQWEKLIGLNAPQLVQQVGPVSLGQSG